MNALLIALSLVACDGADPEDSGADAVDMRMDFPDPPTEGMQIRPPELVIEPYTEKLWCYFDTYTGEDVAITTVDTYQSTYGHHVQLMSTNNDPEDWPDGTLFDCTDRNSLPMTDMDPIYIAVPISDGRTGLTLPEGMGVELESGTRIIIQSHYVNTSADPILVADAINLGTVSPDAVETWASAFAHVKTDMPLPPGEATSIEVNCEWDGQYNLMFVGGHMHEWGTSYTIDWNHDDTTERIYDVPEWDPEYRDSPPLTEWGEGEMVVTKGQSFTTTCNWFNDTEEEMNFPEEMCATFGMAYPSKIPLICDPD